MDDHYTCDHCRVRHEGEPAAMVPRASGRLVPVCDFGLLRRMPSLEELQRYWLECMKASVPR